MSEATINKQDANVYEEKTLRSFIMENLKRLIERKKNVYVFVDGPNMLRRVDDERTIKLKDISRVIKDLGKIRKKVVILDEKVSEKFLQAVTNSGYLPVVALDEVYVELAIEVMSVIKTKTDNKMVVIASRDSRCVPMIQKLKDNDVEVTVIGFEPGFSTAVKNLADNVIELKF